MYALCVSEARMKSFVYILAHSPFTICVIFLEDYPVFTILAFVDLFNLYVYFTHYPQ